MLQEFDPVQLKLSVWLSERQPDSPPEGHRNFAMAASMMAASTSAWTGHIIVPSPCLYF